MLESNNSANSIKDCGDRAKQIVFSTDNLFGGTGTHILNMTKYLDTSLWQPNFLSKARKTVNIKPEGPIDYFPVDRWPNRYPFAQLREILFFLHYLEVKSPDIVHSYFFWPILYGRILKWFGKIKILVENREDQGFDWGRHEYALLKFTRTLPDRVICVSEAVRVEVLRKEELDPERVLVIPNGVSPINYSSVDKASIRRELGFKEDDLVVGMVANYDRPIKGVTYFLESIPSILREVPSARFLIVGKGGKEEGPMRERAKSLAIDSVLTFSGYQNIVSKYYQIMDISTMTSLTEGLSITLLESMSFCLPVVATNVGGNPEVVVDSYTGFLVPPKDIHSFAERVVHLLRNPDLRLRMGQEGRRRVEEKFQMTNVSRQYTQLYRDLIEVGR